MSEAVQDPGEPRALPSPATLAAHARDADPGDGVLDGDAAVEEALRRLEGVDDLDLAAQAATFEAVHTALQERLADAEG
ncbi:hypothetical protein [Cellulomonas sp. HD19AZ1]|uniref:hypothetical protein n=1 Tax=Cellulomonas sp. HD19AZ1 TaxID=2559593 RepID=UPI00107152B0|nr:hypothetical protein [Cellulomonas sp. HD19AZ1]TFH69700.1 hypothetical protein E4A51_16885 [Cellulomonas sp. HD19AZ1]